MSSGKQRIAIAPADTIIQDSEVEGDETFYLRLGPGPAASLGNVQVLPPGSTTPGTSTVTYTATIRDDENVPPTASNSTVRAYANQDYTFAAADFKFADTNVDDALASVKIVTLPTSGRGTLKLGNNVISGLQLPLTLTETQLGQNRLSYSPPTDVTGEDFASFTFRVNDGDVDSSDAYTMTVDVRPAIPTLVSNLGRPAASSAAFGDVRSSFGSLLTGSFTTGKYAHELVTLTLRLRLDRSGGNVLAPIITIRSDNNGSPGGVLFTLDNPSNIGFGLDLADYTFRFPPQTRLAPNTTYWVGLDSNTGTLRGQFTGTPNEDARKAGWSIGNASYTQRRGGFPLRLLNNYALQMRLVGWDFTPTQTESTNVAAEAAADFPYSDETWGFVDTSASSSGTLDATHDSRRRTGDWWKLRVEPHRRYRVQVQFGSTTSQATGGGIDVNYNNAWWDHNRDDGLAFIEFTTISEPYYLRVRARDFLNSNSRRHYGPYTVTLTDITGITKKVSNSDAYSGSKTEVSNTLWKASSFSTPVTTGANTGGYKLSYVGTGLHPRTGASSVRAELWTSSGGVPGTKIFDFDRIGAITGHPTAQRSDRFWAPASAANLAANTKYWVLFKDMNSGSTYEVTRADSGTDNPGAASGWTIQQDNLKYDTTATSPSWTNAYFNSPIVLEIFASNVATTTTMNASQAVDSTAPQLQSATVDGSTLTLAYDEPLDVTDTPPLSAFTVNVGGSPRQVIAAAVGEYNVLLFLSPPVEAGEAVTVDYTAPADEEAGRVRDTSGNAAASFSGQAVTNDTTSDSTSRSVGPGSPTNFKVALQDSGELRASWDAPDSGSAPTDYTVQWKESGDAWTNRKGVTEVDVTVTSHVISGLTDGTEYAVRVFATRDGADSAPSEEVTAMPQETTPPELSSAGVDGATPTLTFNEALDTDMIPHTSAFTVTVAGGSRGVEAMTVSGSAVTLTLVTAVFAGDTVTVDYTAPAGEPDSRLRDLVGNAAASFSGQSVTNDTQAAVQLTASAHDVPANHDGNSAFTFEVRFSEEPAAGFSYKTLRDNAFTVTGGEVVKARRLEKGKNVRWEIHVTPDGTGPVTIVLPATTDCDADGAVCTGDGRKLSQELEFEVPGLSTPEITSGSSFSVDEGATQVATLRARDGDTPAANLTWSISGGDDEAKFAVTAAGVLSFAAAKDYETPDDAGADGVYEVTVQVSDGGRTDSADLTVTLTNVNEAPTADAGSDQADVEQGAAVTLSGSGTDPDSGDTLSYAWTQNGTPAVTLSDSAVASPTFTAPTGLSADTALTFTLRVTDAGVLYAEDSVTVAISGQLPLTPLTASTHDVPANHDGNSAFTFELRFSEEPAAGFSYKTLRDNAFTVTGGEVVKARRLEKGKNVRWEISVTPDGNGPVTIVLPVSTDCTAQGAICTQDGRMLSNRLEITVPGPGG